MATRTLRECLEDLPQELYDEIYAFTLTPPRVGEVILIEKSYKPPATSQVNRAARKSYKISCMRHCFVAELEDLILWLKAQGARWQLLHLRSWTANVRSEEAVWLFVLQRMLHFDKSVARHVKMFSKKEDAMNGTNPIQW